MTDEVRNKATERMGCAFAEFRICENELQL